MCPLLAFSPLSLNSSLVFWYFLECLLNKQLALESLFQVILLGETERWWQHTESHTESSLVEPNWRPEGMGAHCRSWMGQPLKTDSRRRAESESDRARGKV